MIHGLVCCAYLYLQLVLDCSRKFHQVVFKNRFSWNSPTYFPLGSIPLQLLLVLFTFSYILRYCHVGLHPTSSLLCFVRWFRVDPYFHLFSWSLDHSVWWGFFANIWWCCISATQNLTLSVWIARNQWNTCETIWEFCVQRFKLTYSASSLQDVEVDQRWAAESGREPCGHLEGRKHW